MDDPTAFLEDSSLEAGSNFDALGVILIGIIGGCLVECLCWCLVYRHPDFQRLHHETTKLWRKKQSDEEKGFMAKIDLSRGKKEKNTSVNTENEYQRKNKCISAYRQRASLICGVIFMAFMPIAYSIYEGVPVAKLPFTPFPPITFITHANLAGSDMTDCSATFLCMTTIMLTRSNIQKLLGYSAPGGVSQQNLFRPQSLQDD